MSTLNLTTQYAGLKLRNPLIVGSSGLTNSVKSIKDLEEHGAAAVILKSIFQEEITREYEKLLAEADSHGRGAENLDYFDHKIKQDNLDKYLTLIEDARSEVFIPVIASINCTSGHEWVYYAKMIEAAGADALELNMFMLPTNIDRSASENEKAYLQTATEIVNSVSIPVTLKISHYFSDLARMIYKLSETGVAGLVLFNKFFSPDIDIQKIEIMPHHVLSSPDDLFLSLRWIAMMSQRVNCDLVASTGVHTGEAMIKQLLAGARAVQTVSTVYKHGGHYLQTMLDDLERWMTEKGFSSVDQFRGRLSQKNIAHPDVYERMQFMRYFGGYQQDT